MDIFVINLPKSIERRQFQQRQLSKLKLDYQIISAVSAKDIDNNTYQKHYYDWQRPLRKAEVACYFSHQKLWSKIIKNNQVALILEDDALLSKHTPVILQELEKYSNIDMINLEMVNRKKYVAKNFNQSINQSIINYFTYIKIRQALVAIYCIQVALKSYCNIRKKMA